MKQNDKRNLIIGIILIGILGFMYYRPTQGSESQLSIDVNLNDNPTLSVTSDGISVLSVSGTLQLHLEVTGTATNAIMDGQFYVKYDGEIKDTANLIIQSTNDPTIYDLASLSVLANDIETWTTTPGNHDLVFETSDSPTLTVTFSDGNVETKTFSKAIATLIVNYQFDSGIDVADLIVEDGTEEPPVNPPPAITGPYFGFSSYPRDSSGSYQTWVIDNIITEMDQNNLNCYRMSIYYTQPVSLAVQMGEYYLSHCDYDLILCRHVYDPGATSISWSSVDSWVYGVADGLSQYQDRLIIEFVNEYDGSDLGTHYRTLCAEFRAAGYTAGLLANKWNQAWSSLIVDDPLDNCYIGYHYHFNSWSVSGAETQMQYALDTGMKVINTEIGADFNEASAFDSSEVGEVNTFAVWCEERGIGNFVWQRYGLENYNRYVSLGLRNPLTGNLMN